MVAVDYLFSGIPALKNARTTLMWYTQVLPGNVSPFGWTCLLHLCKASTMSVLRFSFSFRWLFNDLCFIDWTWLLTTLFFTKCCSLHNMQNSLPADMQRLSSAKSLTWLILGRHWFHTVKAKPPFNRFWVTGGGFIDTFLFLANTDGIGEQSLSSHDATLFPSDRALDSPSL